MPTDQPASRRGRRPGPSHTREAILEAARARFAEDGYRAATVRRIAADAGVDAALVSRAYGSKEELFAAAMSLPREALARLDAAVEGPVEGLGERFTRAFLGMWEAEATIAEPLHAMFRSAITDEQTAAQLREFIQARLLRAVVPRLEGPDATLRAGLASTMLIGVVVGRHLVRIPALTGTDLETVVGTVAPGIQQVLSPPTAPG